MTKILKMRDNNSIYLTDAQAEKLYESLNANPNLRILKIITGFGYQYITPGYIGYIASATGDSYISEADLLEQQQRGLAIEKKKGLATKNSAGLIGANND